MSGSPQAFRDRKRIDLLLLPPSPFVARLVQLMVMGCTKGNGELITHLKAKASWLCVANMMGVGRRTATDETRLLRYELQVFFASMALGLTDRQDALVNFDRRFSILSSRGRRDLLIRRDEGDRAGF